VVKFEKGCLVKMKSEKSFGLVSGEDASILQFLREHLPRIRRGELSCQVIGYDSMAFISGREEGRVPSLNLAHHIAPRERILDTLPQDQSDNRE
jgi:hypothetical protein